MGLCDYEFQIVVFVAVVDRPWIGGHFSSWLALTVGFDWVTILILTQCYSIRMFQVDSSLLYNIDEVGIFFKF